MAPNPNNRRSNLPPDATREIGTVGVAHQGGIVKDEFLHELRGARGARIFREMRDNDPVCGAILYAVEAKLRAASYTVKPVEDHPQAQAVADFINECLDDMSHTWDDHLAEVVDFATYGWQLFECVYKRRRGPGGDAPSRFNDGRIGWRKFAPRAQESLWRWEIDEHGGIQGMVQQNPNGAKPVTIPMDRCILYRTSRKRNLPEGHPLLRAAYRAWFYRKRLEEFEAIGIERDLSGIPKIKVPLRVIQAQTAADQAALRTWQDIGEGLRQDESAYVMVPSEAWPDGTPMYDVTLMPAPGTKAVDVNVPITRYAAYAAMSILADVIVIGHEQVGSYSLAGTKLDLLDAGLQALADEIGSTFTRFAIARLVELNGWPAEACPQMVAGDVGRFTLEEIANYLATLGKAGIPLGGDLELEQWLRARAGLPMPSEEPA